VTGGSALSKEDIDRMVKDAEEHAEEDKKRRDEADTRNHAEAFAYQTEKVLEDDADKIPAEVSDEVKEAIAAVRTALEGTDLSEVKAKHEALMKKAQKIGEALYAKSSNPEPEGKASPGDEEVVDAEVVDEDEK
jgi:molecular chaperone DnaK